MSAALRSDAGGTYGALQFNGVDAALFGASGFTSKIQPITASVAASALTITLNPTVLDFRSATIGSGAVTTLVVGAAITVVVPSTATLGTVNAIASRLVVIAINNAGTVELAVVNISGGTDLSETGVISTTTIAAASNSASTIYSTTGRSSVAYRVVGFVDSTQSTAGTWATAPSTIQGIGGQALAALSSLGYGQTWQSVTRTSGTTYYNTTGKPIVWVGSGGGVGVGSFSMVIAGLTMPGISTPANIASSQTFIIPPGVSYVHTSTYAFAVYELR